MSDENPLAYPGESETHFDAYNGDGVASIHYPELQYPDDHFFEHPTGNSGEPTTSPGVKSHTPHPHHLSESTCMREARNLIRHGTEELMLYHRITGHEGPLPGQMTGLYHGWNVYLGRTENRLNELLQSIEGDDIAEGDERAALVEARDYVKKCVLQLRPSIHFVLRPLNRHDLLSPIMEIGHYYEVTVKLIADLEALYIQCGGAANSGITINFR